MNQPVPTLPPSGRAPLPPAPARPSAPPAPRFRTTARAWAWLTRTHTLLALAGVIGLAWWGSWWFQNLRKNHVQHSPAAWFGPFPYLGLDFLHNYHAARHWLAGGNPYREPFGDPLGRKLCYPPIVLPFFAWCRACSPRTATIVWTVALAGMAGAGAWAACRARRPLGLWPVPLSFGLAAVLASAPVEYAMERGNYDLLVLPLLLTAAWALRERTAPRDAAVGVSLALATCFKVYPGLLIIALVPLRRWRAVAFAGAAGLAFAAYQPHNIKPFVANLKELAFVHNPLFWGGTIQPVNHSIGLNWQTLWTGTKLKILAKIPGPVATAALLGPALLLVVYRVYRCPDPRRILLPYLLWTAAAATFVPKVANDYNLFFLLLAALAVWDRRDPVPVHIVLGSMFLWAQPIQFVLSPGVALGLKVAALFGVAAALLNRIREQSAVAPAAPPAVVIGPVPVV